MPSFETPSTLTPRQEDILFYICKGLRNAEIGALLGITERTVKMYVRQLFDLFEVTNRTELAVLHTEAHAGRCTEVHVPRDIESASEGRNNQNVRADRLRSAADREARLTFEGS